MKTVTRQLAVRSSRRILIGGEAVPKHHSKRKQLNLKPVNSKQVNDEEYNWNNPNSFNQNLIH